MSNAALTVVERWETYAMGSAIEHFRWWCAEHCRHSIDDFAGLPFDLEPWEMEFLGEALAVDDSERWIWETVLLLVPRKNGKTSLLAAYALYRLVHDDGSPEILVAASSDEQAGRLFDAAVGMIRQSPYLTERLHVRDYIGEIVRKDGGGVLYRLSSDPKRLHGYNPSLVVCDELHAWTTPSLESAWGVLNTADAARRAPQVFAITVAGEAQHRDTSILGTMLDGALATGRVETIDCLSIVRHRGAHLLVYVYEAPPEADPRPLRTAAEAYEMAIREHGEDSPQAADRLAVLQEWRATVGEAAKRANPASWITAAYLAGKAENPKITPGMFLQLHACIWSDTAGAFISAAMWDACAAPGSLDRLEFIAPGARVDIGADGSRTYDCTAVAWARMADDGCIEVDCHVFAAREAAPHHEMSHIPGRIDFTRVEAFLAERDEVYRIAEAAYDPRYLDRSADLLVDRLSEATIFPVEPNSKHRHEAEEVFERLVLDGKLRHRGDPVLRAHVLAAAVERDPKTKQIRRVFKRNEARPIDALAAMTLAVWRASRRRRSRSWRPL